MRREFDLVALACPLVAVKTVQAAARLIQRQDLQQKPVLSSWKSVIDYCHSVMAHEPIERFRLLFLDGKNVLIADEEQSTRLVGQMDVVLVQYPGRMASRPRIRMESQSSPSRLSGRPVAVAYADPRVVEDPQRGREDKRNRQSII